MWCRVQGQKVQGLPSGVTGLRSRIQGLVPSWGFWADMFND